MRSTRRLLVALVAGVIAAGLFIVVLTQAYSQRNAGGGAAASAPTVSVVVAKLALTPGTQLTDTNIGIGTIPATQYASGSNLTLTSQAVGQYVSIALPAGQAVLQSMLVNAAPSAANTVSRAPLPIDKGMEAIGIPYDPTTDVGGYIQPSDHLDILVATPDGSVHYGFEDVPVLRVNPPAGAGKGTVVVELSPQKASTLAFLYAAAPSNIIRFVLRPQTADGSGNLAGQQPVGAGNWKGFLDS